MPLSHALPRVRRIWTLTAENPDGILAVFMLLIFIAGGFGLPSVLPIQLASWMAFAALVLVPGYLLALLLTWNLELDWIDRLSLSFPLGIAALTPSGLFSLLLHLTADVLLYGWILTTLGIIIAWMFIASQRGQIAPKSRRSWARDEVILLIALLATFMIMFPALSVYRVDGDLYTFLTKVSDALTGTSMNLTEPIFGTDLGAGVRSAFNQFFPLWTLWSMVSRIDPINLTAYTSRAMFALLALLASYSLGKAVAGNDRRAGLITALVQSLVYMAGPFFRPDNVSVFFLERTNADKFTVAAAMLPVVFSLVLYFWRTDEKRAWITASVAAFGVSAVHPLIATMLALGITAFGGVSLLIQLRSRQVWWREIRLGFVVAVTMFLPILLLVMSRGSEPLAPTYPESFEGWSVGREMTPATPFIDIPTLDWFGPTPELSQLSASDAEGDLNPFLVWRFIFNIRRQRLVLFNRHSYISDPTLMMEPAYVLALLLLLPALWRPRDRDGAVFLGSTTFAMLMVMYNPVLTPIVGSVVVPWLLWRFVWLFPYAPIIVLGVDSLRHAVRGISMQRGWTPLASWLAKPSLGLIMLSLTVLGLAPTINKNLRDSINNASLVRAFPVPEDLLERLDEETSQTGPVMVAADQLMSIPIPAYAANANIIGHRIFNTSEFFPADQQDRALQRLIDQDRLYRSELLTQEVIEILRKYAVSYIVTSSGSDLDAQLRLAPRWFEWLIDDRYEEQTFSLYAVRELPDTTSTLTGNSYLADRDWENARAQFIRALRESPSDSLALAGLAEIEQAQGRFDQALIYLRRLGTFTDEVTVEFQTGNLYIIMGETQSAISYLLQAWDRKPEITRYALAVSDACLRLRKTSCVEYALETVVADIPDHAARMRRLGELWRQRGEQSEAQSHFESAYEISPSQQAVFQLAGAWEELGRFAEAEDLLLSAQRDYPLSPEYTFRLADHYTERGDLDRSISLYRRVLQLQNLRTEESTQTRLALSRTLLSAGDLEAARAEVEAILAQKPTNAAAYVLLGNLLTLEGQASEAIEAYRTALELDPTEISGYVSLREEYLQQANLEENLELLQLGTDANPEEPNLLLSLGDQLQQYGQLQAAQDAYQQALDYLESPGFNARGTSPRVRRLRGLAYGLLGQVNEQLGNPELGIRYYNAATAAAPFDATVLLRFGNALRRQNRVAEAEETYQRALEVDTNFLPAYIQMVELLRAQERLEEANEFLDRALRVYLESPATNEPSLIQLSAEIADLGEAYIGQTLGSGPGDLEPFPQGISPSTDLDVEAFLEVLQSSPTTNSAIALARIYQERDQIEEAINLYLQEIDEIEGGPSPLSATLSRLYSGLGQLYLIQGQTSEARRAFEQAIANDRVALEPRLGLARTLNELGNQDASLQLLQETLEAVPGSVNLRVAYANALERSGDSERAEGILRELTDTYPGNTNANLAYARVLLARGERAAAERVYRQVIRVAPNQIDAYTQLSDLLFSQGEFGVARSLLESARDIDRLAVDPILAMANLSAHLAEHDQALATYQRALEIEPTNIRALNGIAQIHRLQGDFDRAIEILNLSADLNPTAIDPLVELAPLYQALGEPELALNALQTALARSSDTGVSIRLAIADLHRRQGRDEAALSELEALSDEEPDSISALVALAREYLRRGEAIRADELVQHALTISSPSAADLRSLSRLLEALGEFEQALDLVQMAAAMDPMNPTSLLQLGGLSNELSDYPAALAAYKHATEIGTSDGRTWLSYGDFLLQTGEREAALESYGNGMSFDPTFIPNYSATVGLLSPETDIERMDEILAAAKEAVPANALVGLVEAQFLRDQQEWAAAEDLLRGAIANAPGALELYLALGNLQMQLGRYAEAIESFSHATRIDKTSVEASIGIAEALRLSGDRSEAISTLEEAWTSNPPSPESQILLAELYREEFRPELAEVALRNALERFPTNTSVELELIDFYHRNGLHRVALDHASSLAEDWPDSMDLQIAYGNSLRQAGQTAEAEVIFGRAESLSSVTSAGLRALAAVREAEDNYEEARALLDRAISLDPEDPLNWVALADLLIQLEFYPDAKQALDRSIEIEPDDPRMWIALGDYYLSVDFPVSAIDAFKRALEIAPSSTQAYRGLVDAYVQRFEIYPETTDYARLNEIFAKMEQIAPGSYQIDIIQSSALQSQRRWFEAIDALQSAIAKAPGVPDPYLALGTALGRTAQYEAMRDVYLRALVVEPTNSRAFDGIDTYYRTAETPDEDMPLIHTAAYMTALLERDVHVGPQAEELSRDLSPSGSQINAYLRSLPVDPGRD